ncbi:MMPL family transporter [candidate division KSB1 bacterium]|nr:MMPL family transporter [candidate division KSB1 bacterium]
MRVRVLKGIAGVAEKRPLLLLFIILAITLIAGVLSGQLKLEMHFKNLMPEDHPMVQEFDHIIDHFSTASMIIVAARGQESELKSFADELAPQLEKMTGFIQRVEYKLERDFYLKHGFMLQKAKDLKNSRDIYSDLSLLPWLSHVNDNLERTYVYDDNSLSTKEKENNAVIALDGIEFWLDALSVATSAEQTINPVLVTETAERLLIGDEYLISQDKDMLLIFAEPTFTLNDVDLVIEASDSVDAIIQRTAASYPSVFAGSTGTMALARDETVAASQDAYVTTIIAFILIIMLFILSFRMWVSPLFAGISLIVGVIWTAGFAAVTLGSLNMMTSMFSVILLGLGVDFSIHLITVFTELRAAGQERRQALEQSLLKSGNGIITGALTTACAFLTLTVSETAGMREFGIVAGSGVILTMISALMTIPALLSLRDKTITRLRKQKQSPRPVEFAFLASVSGLLSRRHTGVLVSALVITAALLYSALHIRFDYNYLNMEPKGLTSIKLQHEMEDEFDVTPDFSLVTSKSVEASRAIANKAKDLKMVGMVTSISEYIPSQQEQQQRLSYIREIRNNLLNQDRINPLNVHDTEPLIDELYRLEDNIIELAQLAYLGGQDKVDLKAKSIVGDLQDDNRTSKIEILVNHIQDRQQTSISRLNTFQQDFAPVYRGLALGMAATTPITLDSLPRTITDRYVSDDGSEFLVSIYPKTGVWEDLGFLERFTQRMHALDDRITGIPSIFYVLMGIIGRDGRVAAGLTLVIVFLLLLLDFRKLRYALLAMMPLVIGAIWMVGIMSLTGLKLTLVNVIGIPLILGIGIDDGVHILHRYQTEGRSSIRHVFASTGKAVLLTSLTTMLAFGSLVFATYRGLGSMGLALFIGVGACFLATILVLPALLGWLEKATESKSSKGDMS